MANKIKPENKIRQLEAKVNEAKTILAAINFMNLDGTFPEKLREAVTNFLNDSKNGN